MKSWAIIAFVGTLTAGAAHADEPFARCRASKAAYWSSGTTYNLGGFLANCPTLANDLIWENASGGTASYAAWSSARRTKFLSIFDALVAQRDDLGIECPDPLLNMAWPEGVDARGGIYLTATQAFDVYAAHAAHALYLEVANKVPWSIFDIPTAERRHLLASPNYHARIIPSLSSSVSPPQYPAHILPNRDFQQPFRAGQAFEYMVCDPRDGYRFITGAASTKGPRSLLGTTQTQTLANLSAWVHDNVYHGDASHYASRYIVSLFSSLRSRLIARPVPAPAFAAVIAPAGCHSASNLLYDLARSVNIPLLNVATQESVNTSGYFGSRTHRGLAFQWTGSGSRILPHVDDLYTQTPGVNFQPGSTNRSLDFFNETWLTPAALASWSFAAASPAFPTVYPGSGWGVNGRGAYEDRADYGVILGYWPNSPINAPVTQPNNLVAVRTLDEAYDLCASDMVQRYCQNSAGFAYFVQTTLNANIYGAPVVRTSNDFLARAAACLQSSPAQGNCNALPNVVNNWWGTTFGADSSNAVTLSLNLQANAQVKSKPVGLDCSWGDPSGACTARFPPGTVVSLTVTTAPGIYCSPSYATQCVINLTVHQNMSYDVPLY